MSVIAKRAQSANDELTAPPLPLRSEKFRLYWLEQGRNAERDFDTFEAATLHRDRLKALGIVGRMVRIVTTVEE